MYSIVSIVCGLLLNHLTTFHNFKSYHALTFPLTTCSPINTNLSEVPKRYNDINTGYNSYLLLHSSNPGVPGGGKTWVQVGEGREEESER